MQVQLIDFGFGEILHDQRYKEFAGTPLFCPPEVFKHVRTFDIL